MNAEPQAVVSGRNYRVVEVAGGPVGESLADFLGPVEFVLTDPDPGADPDLSATPDSTGAGADEWRYVVSGIGAHSDTGVRFYEKDPQRHGADVRIWSIESDPAGGFHACHDAAI